jgi:hypothetical protein
MYAHKTDKRVSQNNEQNVESSELKLMDFVFEVYESSQRSRYNIIKFLCSIILWEAIIIHSQYFARCIIK